MFSLNETLCIGCGRCVADCGFGLLDMKDGHPVLARKGCIGCGHCVAVCPKGAVSLPGMEQVLPYEEESFKIEPERFLNFLKFRRTVRHFRSTPVPREKVELLLQAGRYTPTGGNSQNVRYIVVDKDREPLRRLIVNRLKAMSDEVLAAPENFAPILTVYARIWLLMYLEQEKGRMTRDRLFFGAPVIILFVGPDATNCAMASQSVELMANAMGLGCVFSGFTRRGLEQNAEFKEAFGLKPDEEVCAAMMVGYPNVKYYRTVPRKETQVEWR